MALVVGAMHVPNRAGGRKYPFLDAALACARRWRLGPALFVGDTNSGRRGIDEEAFAFSEREEGWIDSLAACGWADAFRHLHGDTRVYTWYSPNGRNGFRIDQAFINQLLLPHLRAVAHVWAGATRRRRDALSDHAALLVDLTDRTGAGKTRQQSCVPPAPASRGKMGRRRAACAETLREEDCR
jgi:exonuclease III